MGQETLSGSLYVSILTYLIVSNSTESGDCCYYNLADQKLQYRIHIETGSVFCTLNTSSVLIPDSLLHYCVLCEGFKCPLQCMQSDCFEDSETRSALRENFLILVSEAVMSMRLEMVA